MSSKKYKTASPILATAAPVSVQEPDFWQKAIFWCFNVLFFAVPLIFTWVNEELFEFNKMLLTYAVAAIIAGLWITRMILYKKLLIRRSIFDLPILLFLISQILSTIFSINFHTSVFGYYTRFHQGLLATLSYITLFYAFISNISKRQLPHLFVTIFASALLVSMWAIPEHFGHSFSCLLVNTNQQMVAGKNISLANIVGNFNDSCWVQDVQNRVFASFGQPNWLAAYAIMLIPLGIVLASIAESKKDKALVIFYAITSLELFVTLLFTKSRSGILGLAVGLALFAGCAVALLWKNIKQENIRAMSLRLARFAVIFALAVAIFGTPFTRSLIFHTPAPAIPSLSPTSEDTPAVNRLDIGGTDSGNIRKIVWTGALRIWKRYPIFGSGVETFAYSYYLDRPVEHNLVSEWDFLYNKAHNEFLNFLATTGTLGFFTYCLMLAFFIGYPLWMALQRFRTQDIHQLLFWVSLSAGQIALAISNFFGFSTVMVTVLMFIFPAIFWITLAPEDDLMKSTETDGELSMAQISGLIFLFLTVVVMLFSIYTIWTADALYSRGKAEVQSGRLSDGLSHLQEAAQLSPREPIFYEQLAIDYAQVVPSLSASGDATSAAQLTQIALQNGQKMLDLNPVNLNSYKSEARMYLFLAEVDPKYLDSARSILLKARQLAPTDAKILYNIAVIEIAMKLEQQGIDDLIKTIQLKGNYEAARMMLGDEYMKLGKLDNAKAQYQYVLQNIQSNNDKAKADLASIAASEAASLNKK